MESSSQFSLVHHIREQNLQVLLRALHQEQVATVAHLKDMTGLSIVTINKLLAILVESGEVLVGEQVSLLAGRPARTYRFNASSKLILIVSCYKRGGHDYAGYAIHELFGECIEWREELLATILTDEFRIGIERYLDRYRKIAMIGISMPSDTIGGRVASAIRHDPQSKRLAKHMRGRVNVPVFFETAINAATLGCYIRNSIAEYVAGLALFRGRAPVCGFCYNGNVLRGENGLAGEVRFFPMYNDMGVLPEEPAAADELAVRTLRAVMCVLNPSLVVVYTEDLKPGLADRLKKSLATEAEITLLPRLEVNDKIRDDIVSGMVALSLDQLNSQF